MLVSPSKGKMYLLTVVLCCLSFSTTSYSLDCYNCKHVEVHCDVKSITDGFFVTCRHLSDSSCPSTQAAVGQIFCFVNIKFSGIDWSFMATSSTASHDNSPYNQTRQTCETFEFVDNGSTRSLSPVGGLCSCTTSNCNALGNYTITLNRNFSLYFESLSSPSATVTDDEGLYSTTTQFDSITLNATVHNPTGEPTGEPTGTKAGQDIEKEVIITISVLILAVLFLFNALLIAICFMYRKHVSKRTHHSMLLRHVPPPVYKADLVDEQFPITILNTIGYGKFGSVYKGIYEGTPVAVKVFSSHHHNSWSTEKNIYTQVSTPHKNILRFIDCKQRGYGPHKQYFMITEYFSLGSLSRFLQHNQLNLSQTLNIIHSVSSGLAHLHSNSYTDQEGSVNSKFSIAHRDVKSANVLVKDTSGHCVLGDLGLGLILDPTADVRKMAKCGQVGTYRYMAPEALDARVNLRDIESFKQIDIYALALVLWEVCSRCEIEEDIPVPPYQSPYFSIVGERPTIELMKHVVVVEKTRPDIMACWESHSSLKQVVNLMEESWDEDSEARLTAANVVSRLNDIIKKTYEQDNPTNDSNNCDGDTNASTVPNTLSSTNNNDPIGNSHKKVRVSSSFSGQSAINTPGTSTTNKSGRTRFSVGTNESPHTYIQKFHRRNSLTYQRNDSLSNHCVNQFLPSRFDAVVTPLTESSDSAPQHDNNNLTNTIPLTELSDSTLHHDNDLTSNNPTMNIDAATGQPSTAAANESTFTSHEEYSIASSTDNV